jgi:hypothetical protein
MRKPPLFGVRVHLKGLVAHPKPRVATLFAIGGGTTKVLLEEMGQAPNGTFEVVSWVHREQDRVLLDTLVKLAYKSIEGGFATNSLEQGHTRSVR